MARRLKIGDLIEIPTQKGLSYAHYTHKDKVCGQLIFVYKGFYHKRPNNLKEILTKEVQFYTFFPLTSAVNHGDMTFVENIPLVEHEVKFPLFRTGMADPKTKKIEDWWIWDGKNSVRVGTLDNDQKKLPPRGVWNDTLLIKRIEDQWSPDQ
ncbi:hypothetical protein [Microbulbifer epialgicus]|uniref:Immunity protein 26 n=1 Tax=Microbulbifer epialgicus TaxID=393907 RepID=A0ABV4NWB7_9GAMM